jgi:hypothetical protein
MSPMRGDATAQVYDRSPIRTHALSVSLERPVPETLSAEIDRITRARVHEPQVFFVRTIGFREPTAARRSSYEESRSRRPRHGSRRDDRARSGNIDIRFGASETRSHDQGPAAHQGALRRPGPRVQRPVLIL